MRVVAVLSSLVIALSARVATGQCDPRSERAAGDPFTRALTALHAPRPAEAARTRSVRVKRVVRSGRVAPQRALGRTSPAAHRARRRAVAISRPTGAGASRADVRATRTTTACRSDDALARRLAGGGEPTSPLDETMRSPFSAAPAPSIASAPAMGSLPAMPAPASLTGLGAGPIGTLAGAGIGTTPGITAGIVLGAAVTVGAGTALWHGLHHGEGTPDGSGAGAGRPTPRTIAPPTGPAGTPAVGDAPPTQGPADPTPGAPSGNAPAPGAAGPGTENPGPSAGTPAATDPTAGTPPIGGVPRPQLPGELPTPPAIPGLPFPGTPLFAPPAPPGGGSSGPSTDPQPGPDAGHPGPATTIPEPGSAWLVSIGVASLATLTLFGRRRRRRTGVGSL